MNGFFDVRRERGNVGAMRYPLLQSASYVAAVVAWRTEDTPVRLRAVAGCVERRADAMLSDRARAALWAE
ncbi:hypothetical protein TSOC111612_06375 [Tsukamurella ocularis]